MTRVAFVGAGGMSAHHAAALARLGGVEVVGVCAREEERAAAFARRHGGRPFTKLSAMLDEARPQAVWVCVTPDAHGEVERLLCERRVPFFVEKPLALDHATAAPIAAAVEQAGLLTAVGYHWRYLSTTERARELLAGRTIGLVQGFWLTRTPAPYWWSKRGRSGGQMIEQTTHLFDLARYLVGEAETVFAMTRRVEREAFPVADVDEVSAAMVRFAGGTVAQFGSTCLLNASYRVGLHLFCEGLALELGQAGLIVDDGTTRTEHRAEGDATEREDRAFLAALAGGDRAQIRSSYADALATHRLATRAVESAEAGRPLSVA